ncbi:hypothetical protein ZIOFF_063200 [Zingiber officinale]|uniref:Uncharacterized protein n=1 Tax=Zingiber officinale TaxID=94328 RepID=A0A8J5KJY7_ZINOF|nr:hypothetical protein ZIOFF_063200 [Zingiber officinale]
MPRHNSGTNAFFDGYCTGPKLVTSSCSSSSFSKTHCFKRKVLISKKKGSTTPVPLWRDHARSPQCVTGSHESPKHLLSANGGKQTRVPLSARKLANALWTLSHTPQGKFKDLQGMRSMPTTRRVTNSGCVADVSVRRHICNQENFSASEMLNQWRSSNHRQMLQPIRQKYGSQKNSRVPSDKPNLMEVRKLFWMPFSYHEKWTSRSNIRLHDTEIRQSLTSSHVLQTETSLQGLTSIGSPVGGEKHSYELRSNLVTTKKLMKIFIRLCGLHKKPDSAISLARIIYCQLSQALVSVDQLVHEKESEESKFLHLLNQIVEEKRTWKKKKQEGIRLSFQPIIEGLETERKLRRRAEWENKKLRVELDKVNSSLAEACENLDSERKTREMIEQFCGQMIKEIGDDKAEVEELKWESVKAREELDKERQMLQLADELREERVQMKLCEAKYQYEEKNAAVDQLRCQLEAFLVTKRTKETENEPWNLICDMENDRPRQMVHQSSSLGKLIMDNKDLDEENDETDSEDSDLHLIELNLDDNNNGYCWNHASAAIDDDKLDLSKEKHCWSTKCEKLPGTYLSSEQVTTEGVQENSTKRDQHLDNNLDEGRQIDSIGMVDQYGVPKEQRTENSRIVLPLTLPNSTKQSSRQENLQSTLEQVCLASKVSELLKAFRESESKANLGRMKKVHSELQLTIQ